jgi:hypothetical protein
MIVLNLHIHSFVTLVDTVFPVFTAVKIEVEVFWVVTPCSSNDPEDGGSKVLRNVDILPQHYTASQPRRPRLECT